MGCCCRISKKAKVQNNQEFNAVVNSQLEQKSLPLNGKIRKVIRNDISQDMELKANNETEEYTEVNKFNIQESAIKSDQQRNNKVEDNQVKFNQEISKSLQNHNSQDHQDQMPNKNYQTLNSNIQKEQESVIQEKEPSVKEVLKNNYMSISLPPQTQPHRNDQNFESSQTYILQEQKYKEEVQNEESYISQKQPNENAQQTKFNLGTDEYNLVMQKPDYDNNNLIHNLASRSLPPFKYQREMPNQKALSERDQEKMCRKSQTDILNKKIEFNYQT